MSFIQPVQPGSSNNISAHQINTAKIIVDRIHVALQAEYHFYHKSAINLDNKQLGFRSWDDQISDYLEDGYARAGWGLKTGSGGHGGGAAYASLNVINIAAATYTDKNGISFFSPQHIIKPTNEDTLKVNSFLAKLNDKISKAGKNDKYVVLSLREAGHDWFFSDRRFYMAATAFDKVGTLTKDMDRDGNGYVFTFKNR